MVKGKKYLRVLIPDESSITISWYEGTSDTSLEACIKTQLGVRPHELLELYDPDDDSAVVISSSIPNNYALEYRSNNSVGLPSLPTRPCATSQPVLRHRPVGFVQGSTQDRECVSLSTPLITTGKTMGTVNDDDSSPKSFTTSKLSWSEANPVNIDVEPESSDVTYNDEDRVGRARRFRSRFARGGRWWESTLKALNMQQLNAALAGERTWLAWIRTIVSVLGLGFKINSLNSDVAVVRIGSITSISACAVVMFVLGTLRLSKVHRILAEHEPVTVYKSSYVVSVTVLWVVAFLSCSVGIIAYGRVFRN